MATVPPPPYRRITIKFDDGVTKEVYSMDAARNFASVVRGPARIVNMERAEQAKEILLGLFDGKRLVISDAPCRYCGARDQPLTDGRCTSCCGSP